MKQMISLILFSLIALCLIVCFNENELKGEMTPTTQPDFEEVLSHQEVEELNELFSEKKEEPIEHKENITIDDLDKVELRVGKILSCEKHPKADRLLVSQVKVGPETRQIVSGIAKWYKPEEMVGKDVIVVCNLKPVKLRGVESQGMILAAGNDGDDLIVPVATGANSGCEVR